MAGNRLVLGATPLRLNERLASQKGTFLCPRDVQVGFMANLCGFVERLVDAKKQEMKERLVQYIIPTCADGHVRNDALIQLDRMNITRTTLFPDPDGFEQSLSIKIIAFFLPKLDS
ncbi:MAG: hypothetical protein HY673_02060 [Chloroflexi bacterium]|nr:hypothetical protein [Chloroflexota bacterium]